MLPDSKKKQLQLGDIPAINQEVHRVAVNLSLHSPVEKILSQIITSKKAIRVGNLRYINEEELLRELLLRGAESLESQYPNTLGLKDLLSDSTYQQKPVPKKIEEKLKTKTATKPLPKEEVSKPHKLHIPELNLDNFDFGSSVIEKN